MKSSSLSYTMLDPVILSKVYANGDVIQLEYVCSVCYENPRTKRKHTTHRHGGGNMKDMKKLDWDKPMSFGLRVRHCMDFHNKLSYPVELLYDPEFTLTTFKSNQNSNSPL